MHPKNPTLIVIAVPNGSGKTSITGQILKHKWVEESVYINPDNIAQEMFGGWNNYDSIIKAANYATAQREQMLLEKKVLFLKQFSQPMIKFYF